MTGATSGDGVSTLPEHLSSRRVVGGVRVARSLIFCVVFCRSVFVLFWFSFGRCVVFFFDLRILITLCYLQALWNTCDFSYFICSNISASPAYVVYISQSIQYYRTWGYYHDFLDKWILLTRKLLNQGFLVVKLKSPLQQYYGRHHDVINLYGVSAS
jgi:hypothetical protein